MHSLRPCIRRKWLFMLPVLLSFAAVEVTSAQDFVFFADHDAGNGSADVRVEIIEPSRLTGDTYRIFFNKMDEVLTYTVENNSRQQIVLQNIPFGAATPVFDGLQVTVTATEPRIESIVEVKYGGAVIDPPVHVFRPGDFFGRGGNNSSNEYTIVGGGGTGDYARISRFVDQAVPYDYEMRFDGDPQGKNVLVYAFTGEGTLFNVPFSLWNIGIGTPDDPSDDYQIVAVGFDDSRNPGVYDGGAAPSDGGPGTMFDRVYFFDLATEGGSEADINRDGKIDYEDFLADIRNSGGDVSNKLRTQPYIRAEAISRIALVALNGNPNYRPPDGTVIRFTTSKPPTEQDVYSFKAPQFGLTSSTTLLDFGAVSAGKTFSLPLRFQNLHTATVAVNQITVSPQPFSVSETAFALAPGDTHSIAVSFAPQVPGTFEGTLTVFSDDPFYPSYRVKLTGRAFLQTGGAITLLGQHDVHSRQTADVWGYVDTETGREYAVVGWGYFANPPGSGVMLFDVTDPSRPVKTSEINNMPGFDVKTFRRYVYGVNGNSNGLFGRIADISDPANPRIVGSFPTAHNIFISNNGYLILAVPGITVYDLNTNPEAPVEIWSDNQGNGHDAAVFGDTLLIDFHGDNGTFLYDFRNPSSPVLLGSITDPEIRYHHSGWLSSDGRYLLICDELANHPSPDVTVWDLADIANPVKVASYADPTATVHNVQVIGNYAFFSYYTAGFRVLDITDPRNPQEAERFDTSFSSGQGFDGAFGVYALAPSRNIYISDGQNGLFIFRFAGISTGIAGPQLPDAFRLYANYPNPFNPRTTIRYELAAESDVKLVIYNIMGQPVRELVRQKQQAGSYQVVWDGRNERGEQVGTGMYIYKLEAGSFRDAKRMLLLR